MGETMTQYSLLCAIRDHDWRFLLACVPDEIKKQQNISSLEIDYEWCGDHETDARHVYPDREKLIRAAIVATIGKTGSPIFL